jgi:hypothetical protein
MSDSIDKAAMREEFEAFATKHLLLENFILDGDGKLLE